MEATSTIVRKPVLLVADDINDTFRFSQALRSLGEAWDFFSVPTGEAAIRYLNAAAADENCRPTAVFVDLKLADRDGTELIEWIRGKTHLDSCSVIALSGDADPAAQARAQLRGACDCLAKPVTGAALAFTLARFA